MPTITHFIVPVDDIERAKKFYIGLFGWKIEKMPGPVEYYAIGTTNEKGEKSLGGGLVKRKKEEETIVNYIDVLSIDEYIVKVKNLGGKIIMPKTPVPGVGYTAVCIDTENNKFGLWQYDENAKMKQCQSCGMPLDEKMTSKLDKRHYITK